MSQGQNKHNTGPGEQRGEPFTQPAIFLRSSFQTIRFTTSSGVVEGHPVGPVVAHVPAVLLVPAALRQLGAHRVLLLLLPLTEVGLHPQLLIEVVLALLLVQRLQKVFSILREEIYES